MLMPTIVTDFQETDVLLGRTKQCRGHPGNAKFRGVLDEFGTKYHLLSSRSGRSHLVDQVEKHVVGQGWRFLKFEANLGIWREATKKEIREKISHGFRDRKRQSMSTIASKGSRSRSSSPKSQMAYAEENQSESRACHSPLSDSDTRGRGVNGASTNQMDLSWPLKDIDCKPFNLAECLLSLRTSRTPAQATTSHRNENKRPSTPPITLATTNVSIASSQDGPELDKIKELRRLLSTRSAGALERARVGVSPRPSAHESADGNATPKIRNSLKHDRMHGSIELPTPTKRRRLSPSENKVKALWKAPRLPLGDIWSTAPPTNAVMQGPLNKPPAQSMDCERHVFRRCPPTRCMSRLPFKKRHFIIGV